MGVYVRCQSVTVDFCDVKNAGLILRHIGEMLLVKHEGIKDLCANEVEHKNFNKLRVKFLSPIAFECTSVDIKWSLLKTTFYLFIWIAFKFCILTPCFTQDVLSESS